MSSWGELTKREAVDVDTLATVHDIEIDVGGARIKARVLMNGDHVVIPVQGTMQDGGYFHNVLQCDRRTYERAREGARKRGLTFIRIADIAERFLGHRPLITIEPRLLPHEFEE